MGNTSVVHHLTLFLLLVLHLPLFPVVGSTGNIISSGSTLSVDSSPLKSPSGNFAFGFHDTDNQDLFLLAVWFDTLPNRTIVWSAADNETSITVTRGSQLKLTNDGELVLYDHQGKELWKNFQGSSASKGHEAAILDDGNFVLRDENSNTIWESFKHPTDTILPGQILDMPTFLKSRLSPQNYSYGRFQLPLQADGNLVLYTVSMPSENVQEAYWASITFGHTSKLIFNESGYIYIEEGTKKIFNLTKVAPGPKEEFFRLARIDYDGVFRQYKHPKDESKACDFTWKEVESIPQDICLVITGEIGSGACGYNSYCARTNEKMECLCPEGYSYIDPNATGQGCRPSFSLPSCVADGWEVDTENVDFKEYSFTDWPLSDYDVQIGDEVDMQMCKDLCRKDCFCAAAIFNGNTCWKKKYPLSNGRRHPSVNRTALIKVPKTDVSNRLGKKDQNSANIIVVSALLGSSVFLNILLLLAFILSVYYSYHKKLLLQSVSSLSSTNVRSYTYKELEEATGGFKQTLGRGAFGTVYKGVLASQPKRFIAVKKLDKMEHEGEKEFKTEVSVIGQTHHKNLVCLLGFCDEGEHRLLVYEYMGNGSLASFLFGISRPNWNQRVQIAFGIARGLMYLHEECSTQIIHCDIKPQNILLDEYFTPRISDFGLAKLLLAEQTRAAYTGIRGTVGYFAPEWFRRASITVKVDVYSFGVMLLEIICCKSSVEFAMRNEEEALMDWVYNCYKRRKLDKLAENDEEAKNDLKRLERFVMVSLWCIQEDASLRPTMKKVTQMLEGVIEVSVPPCPWNYGSNSTNIQISMQ
ncbi:G-type lectin S-receptor-like serine/threonine-protein kinase LECRK3 [Pistacia vera]|uniref:G-type lectin S-receptor-like serine/threonine-protein kinase LECRK3 n=1 Tax=Pistacia vera TaxID=55513 RepID=UPI001262AFEA|nr:G-type lectin S-receptor-like serine/threonine-protein kinase LECRK3 [Pistacia vera]